MKRHLAAALLAGLALTVTAACDPVVNSARPKASASPKSPKDVLMAAVPDGSQGTFQCAITEPDMNSSGPVNPHAKQMRWTTVYRDPKLGYQMTMVFLIIDQHTWMKVSYAHAEHVTGLPKLPAKWMAMDRSKLTGAGTDIAGFTDPDPAGTQALFAAIDEVSQTGDGNYQGTLDLTKATGADIVESDDLKALGGKAKAVPFQATVDGAHRLTSVTVDVPAAASTAAFKYHIAYTAYGTAPAISAPPANQVQPAPAAAYALFN